ncbi:trypsin-like serine peptidase [Acrocarpospora catenulata]|uniref:trypsin-like serine peptidase n=1 Tax=Acrocarpospora catenulata TaxID=2836182 RepID=UPI001BDA8401|nr:hypothetical protein [Acrocarpospora catenulata]
MRKRWHAVLATALSVAAALPSSAAGATSADVAGGKVAHVKLTVDEREVRAFWTPERMSQARPIDLPAGAAEFGAAQPSTEASHAPILVPGREPARKPGPPTAAADLAQLATPTVGRLFLQWSDGSTGSCSASTVPSPHRNLILTAGHCVYKHSKRIWIKHGFYDPYFRYGADPYYGSWVLDRAFVSADWLNAAEFTRTNDVAFATIRGRTNGTEVEDLAGSNGMGFFPPPFYQGTVFGYPAEPPYDGNLQMNCTGSVSLTIIKCPFTGGSSGGPWLRDYQNERRWGYVTGLTSTGVTDVDLRSPQFGYPAYLVWEEAKIYD